MTKMNIRQWWDEVGTENVKLVAADIGTSIEYMRLLRYGIKRAGPDRAFAIIDAAKRITPGFEPALELLIAPVIKKTPNPNFTPTIQPSKAFLEATQAQ